MEILKNVATVKSISTESELRRIEYPNGIISWIILEDHTEYKLNSGVWSVFDTDIWDWLPVVENTPTWEREYQEAILAQYPFEKRVREILENNVDVGTVMFNLARDFDFVQLVKEYFKKLPR